MNLGTRMTVFAGRGLSTPVTAPLSDRLLSVTVHETDDYRSVFSLTFDAGRSGAADVADSPVLTSSQLRTGSRISVLVTTHADVTTLLDGFITRVDHTVGSSSGSSQLVCTGEDASWLLDRVEAVRLQPMPHRAQVIILLARYASVGVIPFPIPFVADPAPRLTAAIPLQKATDLGHLAMLAFQHGFVSYAIPGPLPGHSMWYWGPPVRAGLPQSAITVGQVPEANVRGSIDFRLDAHGPVRIEGVVSDPGTNKTVTIAATRPTRDPLSTRPLWRTNADDTRVRLPQPADPSGPSASERAQSQVDEASDALSARGVLDGARYRSVLRPRALVGLRGAGFAHDGLWYVKSVEHTLERGSWSQSFQLKRAGYGSTVPAVVP